jgi:hypothetical protein
MRDDRERLLDMAEAEIMTSPAVNAQDCSHGR